MHRALLSGPDDFEGWRAAARGFAQAGIVAADIVWQTADDAADLFAQDAPVSTTAGDGASFAVPKAFVELAQVAILHRAPERFAMLYALLVALRERPGMMEDRADPLLSLIHI